jgi:hypothetical protein
VPFQDLFSRTVMATFDVPNASSYVEYVERTGSEAAGVHN